MAADLSSHRHPRQAHHVHGPVSFLNPTRGYVDAGRSGTNKTHHPPLSRNDSATATTPEGVDADAHADVDAKPAQPGTGVTRDDDHDGIHTGNNQGSTTTAAAADTKGTGVSTQVWRSRDNRKGRHAISVSTAHDASTQSVQHPRPSRSLGAVARGLWKMVVRYPVWDVSYDVAVMFTLGSVIWVINAFFVWLPLQDPDTEFAGEILTGGGVSAFVGATVFELGSVLLMLEAVNENRTDCFGWALEEALESEGGRLRLRPDPQACSHHHPGKRSLFARRDTRAGVKNGKGEIDEKDGGTGSGKGRKWEWWPTWYELKSHYFREIGFLACFSQFIGATVFWISGFTGLPPIYNALSVPAANGIYWLPQVVGGTGFIVSSIFFMVEVQPKWYIPAPKVLGWHIGFWNLIGALGFTLCGALGFASSNEAAAYASPLATFIGSWAFLIGSAVQWYESLDKYPVLVGQDW